MRPPRHLLVLRLSSLGDVAMTVPVLRNLLHQHPEVKVTVVAAAFVAPLFQNIDRLHFFGADLKGRHKGLKGLYRLYKDVTGSGSYNALADLHNVLRTKILRSLFRFRIRRLAVIDKGRKEKKELTRPVNKKLRSLKSTFERYADVFRTLGLPLALEVKAGLCPKDEMPESMKKLKAQGYFLIGIAPVAQYPEKTYPLQKMKALLRLLASEKVAVYLFGGAVEKAALTAWQEEFSNTTSFAGTGLHTELAAIAHLDVMVSMDSANMHLASLYGVPVVSVWGGTHPYLGFMGWGQSFGNAVQIDLPCRPSSVFGSKPCPNRCACLDGIPPEMIYEKVMHQLTSHK